MDSFKGAESRYIVTRKYCERFIPENSKVVDLGNRSGITPWLKDRYDVVNTNWDLDKKPRIDLSYDYITSFEVFEHLLDPCCVLKNIRKGTHLLCSVPLRVFFTKPHWKPNDEHYHEFLDREFYKLLTKTGWKIKFKKKRCIVKNFGIRQLITGLFRFKRYLFVYAEKM
jgi:hypothetical protein